MPNFQFLQALLLLVKSCFLSTVLQLFSNFSYFQMATAYAMTFFFFTLKEISEINFKRSGKSITWHTSSIYKDGMQ